MEQYFQFTGMTEEKMMEELQPQAEKRIKTRLVLEAVAKAENIEVSEETTGRRTCIRWQSSIRWKLIN